MSIIDRILAILAPYECLGCAAEGDLLCAACTQQLTTVPPRCYRCLTPSVGAFTCSYCLARSNLSRVWVSAAYSGVAKHLVSRLKFAGARPAARNMASCLRPLLPEAYGTIIVPVPTASSRVRGRGFDQAKLLAREISRQTGLPYLDCLARSGHTRQVGTSRQQRLDQLEGAFRVKARVPRGASIVLVDDVLTTGATLETAAKTLDPRNDRQVSAMVFAQA